MPRYELEQFAAIRNYTDITFSPDGAHVAYVTNASGQFNVWRQPADLAANGQPLMPRQLTALVESAARRAVWSPDGRRILTLADRHGTENYQLYEIPAERGWLYPLTDDPESRFELGDTPFSPDGRRIAYTSNERSRTDFDVLVRDLETGATRRYTDGGYFSAESWSPDGRCLLAMRLNSNTDQDLFLIDVESGEQRHLTPHEGEVKFFPGPWAADGSGFYLTSDRGREFTGLAFCRVDTGEIAWVETPEWDVANADVSRDGRYLAWVVNEDGYSRLHVRDLSTGVTQSFPALPRGVIAMMRFSPARAEIALLISRPVAPATLHILDITTGAARRLTQGALGGIPEAEMVEPEVVRYPSHDGRAIPAYLYRPQGIGAGERVPVVLSVHGGPEAQELPTYAYTGFYQFLLNHGIGILAPNIRGSTGYGGTYQKLIHRDWGGAELGDLEHAVRYLKTLDWVDGTRLGVFGGSFGGFATLSCVSRLPEHWAAAVDIVGPSNLVTFTRSVPPSWKRFMQKWVGDPDEDTDELMARSPIRYVDQVRAPLLVIQGANDPRVVKPESDQMVERLRANGATVDYLVFDDEGHGFTKVANSLRAFKATGAWFLRHLCGEGTTPSGI